MKKNNFTNFLKLGVFLFGISLFLWNCEKEEIIIEQSEKSYTLNLGLTKLPPMPSIEYKYFLWASKNGEDKLIGAFSILAEDEIVDGQEFSRYISFNGISKDWVEEEINITITIEKNSEMPSEPSNWIVSKGLGNLTSNSILLSLEGGLFESGNQSFLNSKAGFFLNAPSIGSIGGNHNGIWFIDDLSATAGGFEDFPALGERWEYSAWIILDDNTPADNSIPVPIGKFSNISQTDTSIYGTSFNNEFKGANSVYPFVGEDYIDDPNGKFSNLDFPLDLRRPSSVLNSKPSVIISIRPKSYANTSKPFPIWAFTKRINVTESLSEKIIMDNKNLTVDFSARLSLIQ